MLYTPYLQDIGFTLFLGILIYGLLRLVVTMTSEMALEASSSSTTDNYLDETQSSIDTEHPFSEYTQLVDSTIRRAGFQDYEMNILDELKVFKYVVITKWDNILGPQLIKCWVQSKCVIDENLIHYVNMHVLSGDMDEFNVSSRDRERKLLFLPQQKIIILGIIFSVIRSGSRKKAPKLFCLSFVFPLTCPQRASRITKLYKFLHRSCRGIKECIRENLWMMGTLHSNPKKLEGMIVKLDNVSDHLFHYSVDQVDRSLHYFGYGTSKAKLEFLKKAYQGILQCAGFSLVMGMKTQMQLIEQVSLMISYILPSEDKPCTIFPMANHTEFHSNIFHQSLMYERRPCEIVDDSMFHREVSDNSFPLAIVDVSLNKVFITSTLEKFCDKETRQSSQFELKEIEKYGSFVDKLVDRMAPFRNNNAFLDRIGNMGLTEIRCKVDLLSKLYKNHSLSTVKKTLKFDSCDNDIFTAWACRQDAELKKLLFAKPELTELNYILGLIN